MARQWPAPGGSADRPEPHRPRQTRQQTTSRCRPARRSLGAGRDRRQSARLGCFRGLGRCDSVRAWPCPADRQAARTSSTPTRGMTSHGVVGICASEASAHESPTVASRRNTTSANIAGLWSARMPGLPRSASCAFASSVASISILLCSRSPALLSAPDSLRSFVSGSKAC